MTRTSNDGSLALTPRFFLPLACRIAWINVALGLALVIVNASNMVLDLMSNSALIWRFMSVLADAAVLLSAAAIALSCSFWGNALSLLIAPLTSTLTLIATLKQSFVLFYELSEFNL